MFSDSLSAKLDIIEGRPTFIVFTILHAGFLDPMAIFLPPLVAAYRI
jgi:hypothetical protein